MGPDGGGGVRVLGGLMGFRASAWRLGQALGGIWVCGTGVAA